LISVKNSSIVLILFSSSFSKFVFKNILRFMALFGILNDIGNILSRKLSALFTSLLYLFISANETAFLSIPKMNITSCTDSNNLIL